jgi:Permease MlaE
VFNLSNIFEIAGKVSVFAFQAAASLFRRPFEGHQIRRQLAEVGSKSLPLVIASGFALGAVLTLHTRSTLVTFGATAWIPSVQALAFFLEIGPLVTGLLVAGRVGSGIGAVLSNMRATEQIDAIESLSIDSFKFLVVHASSRVRWRSRSLRCFWISRACSEVSSPNMPLRGSRFNSTSLDPSLRLCGRISTRRRSRQPSLDSPLGRFPPSSATRRMRARKV